MLFYCKMRWDLKGLSFQDLWKLEGQEATMAVGNLDSGKVQHLYKVAAEQYVIVISWDMPSADELDRMAMGHMPMREHLIFEEVFSLEEGFSIDVQSYLKARRDRPANSGLLYYVQMAWDPKERQLERLWSKAKEDLKDLETIKVLGLYRVAGQQRLIVIVDVENAEDLTRLANLTVLHHPVMEKVWLLRDYHLFAEDVWKGYKD